MQKHAISNLTMVLLVLYAIGYLIRFTAPQIASYLTLDPYAILHGQIWRLVSWLLIPPYALSYMVILVLFCFYGFGVAMERTLGKVQYNIYILTGIVLTVVSAFVWYGVMFLLSGQASFDAYAQTFFATYSALITSYYINMSIFVAFTIVHANRTVMLFFVVPVPAWILGVLDVVYMAYDFVTSGAGYPTRYIIAAALINILIFWLRMRNGVRISAAQRKVRNNFRRQAGKSAPAAGAGAGSRQMHKCAICGKTEADDPNMEFRYCSKCEGAYEYCSDHLFTHIHVKNGGQPAMMPYSEAETIKENENEE